MITKTFDDIPRPKKTPSEVAHRMFTDAWKDLLLGMPLRLYDVQHLLYEECKKRGTAGMAFYEKVKREPLFGWLRFICL